MSAAHQSGRIVITVADDGRGIDRETCRTFVRMYVNRDTVQMGDEGRRALDELYGRALRRGLISEMPPLDIVGLEAAP